MTPVLADTSVWIDHFRRSNPTLVDHLEQGLVYCHPLIIGELACGQLPDRTKTLQLLADLPPAAEASHPETLAFLEAHSLTGRALGWIDISLLASARLTQLPLWTLDRPLMQAAKDLGVAHPL